MLSSWANWVGCRPPDGNMRLAAPVPECAYFAEHVRQSAIADAVAQRSIAYLVRKRVDGLTPGYVKLADAAQLLQRMINIQTLTNLAELQTNNVPNPSRTIRQRRNVSRQTRTQSPPPTTQSTAKTILLLYRRKRHTSRMPRQLPFAICLSVMHFRPKDASKKSLTSRHANCPSY